MQPHFQSLAATASQSRIGSLLLFCLPLTMLDRDSALLLRPQRK